MSPAQGLSEVLKGEGSGVTTLLLGIVEQKVVMAIPSSFVSYDILVTYQREMLQLFNVPMKTNRFLINTIQGQKRNWMRYILRKKRINDNGARRNCRKSEEKWT